MPKVQDPILEQAKVAERFWTKVNKNGPVWNGTPCWIWLGSTFLGRRGKTRYGQFWKVRLVSAHRVSYELCVGAIPTGLTLDHLCRNTLCVNPSHLEPVSMRENILRGDGITAKHARAKVCSKGHPYEGYNLIVRYGWRYCRTCHNETTKLANRTQRLKAKEDA